ncbi:MAG: hypothetical protein A3G81_01250 [Betaproteobacteria bacterium RIFCSPLOWO2_12_FULL_65_14]|nr:MAG: hypothetical protein A3G81_01250 [Betaproteobacteria bacterium RIFCSPLOWO2_12_FULL_65_14]
MADTVRQVQYFSIDVPDKPGEAFRVLQTLVSSGINLLACSGHTVRRRARIDVVPDDTDAFKAATAKASLAFTATKSGFLVQGEDRPGALAQNLQRLASTGINVTGIDAMGAGAGRWGAILWVKPEDVSRAASALGALEK